MSIRRTPANPPSQTRISVQDTYDASTPQGTAQINEEFRRIQLFANAMADKIEAIDPKVAAIEQAITPPVGGRTGDSPLYNYLTNIYGSGVLGSGIIYSGKDGQDGKDGKDGFVADYYGIEVQTDLTDLNSFIPDFKTNKINFVNPSGSLPATYIETPIHFSGSLADDETEWQFHTGATDTRWRADVNAVAYVDLSGMTDTIETWISGYDWSGLLSGFIQSGIYISGLDAGGIEVQINSGDIPGHLADYKINKINFIDPTVLPNDYIISQVVWSGEIIDDTTLWRAATGGSDTRYSSEMKGFVFVDMSGVYSGVDNWISGTDWSGYFSGVLLSGEKGEKGDQGEPGVSGVSGASAASEDKGWIWYFTSNESDIPGYALFDCNRPDDYNVKNGTAISAEGFYIDHDDYTTIGGIDYYRLETTPGETLGQLYASFVVTPASSTERIHSFRTSEFANETTLDTDWTFTTYAKANIATDTSIRVDFKTMDSTDTLSAVLASVVIATIDSVTIKKYEVTATTAAITIAAGDRLVAEYYAINDNASDTSVFIYHNNPNYYSVIGNGAVSVSSPGLETLTVGLTTNNEVIGDYIGDINHSGEPGYAYKWNQWGDYNAWITPSGFPVAQLSHVGKWLANINIGHTLSDYDVTYWRRSEAGDETFIDGINIPGLPVDTTVPPVSGHDYSFRWHYKQHTAEKRFNCEHWDAKDRLVVKVGIDTADALTNPVGDVNFTIGRVNRYYPSYDDGDGVGLPAWYEDDTSYDPDHYLSTYEPSHIRMPIPEAWYGGGGGNLGITTLGFNDIPVIQEGEAYKVDTLQWIDRAMPASPYVHTVTAYNKWDLTGKIEPIWAQSEPSYRTMIESWGEILVEDIRQVTLDTEIFIQNGSGVPAELDHTSISDKEDYWTSAINFVNPEQVPYVGTDLDVRFDGELVLDPHFYNELGGRPYQRYRADINAVAILPNSAITDIISGYNASGSMEEVDPYFFAWDKAAEDIVVNASGFDGNLTSGDTNVQLCMQKLDDLILPVLPSGTVNQTLRYNSSNVLEATSILQTYASSVEVTKSLVVNPLDYGYSPAFHVMPGTNIGAQVTGTYGSSSAPLQDGIKVQFATRTGVLIVSDKAAPYKPIQAWNSDDGYDSNSLKITQFQVDDLGQWQGKKFYKKSATGSQLYQYNNIVVDEEGNFEKQLKNIAIKTGGTEITLDTPVPIPEMAVTAMRSNEYHLDFRLILEKLAGGESEDVIYNNGMQFIFSNSTANDVSFYNGLSWRADHYYNATLEAQASFHKHADFSNNQTTDALINSVSTNVQRVVLHGEGVFRQHSGSDLLNLKLATVQSGVSGYSVAKGSYMKITLKNEGA